jgi:hypothetical protein
MKLILKQSGAAFKAAFFDGVISTFAALKDG